MTKEYLGKKRFYLNEHPENYVDARIYVVETNNSEYFSAVLENGNAYMIEMLEPLCRELADIESFKDLEGNLYLEYPVKSVKNIRFYDRKSAYIGTGDLSILKIKKELLYIGDFTVERSFKYKCNGWDYTQGSGEHLALLMHPTFLAACVKSWTSILFGSHNSNGIEKNLRAVLINDYFTVYCDISKEDFRNAAF